MNLKEEFEKEFEEKFGKRPLEYGMDYDHQKFNALWGYKQGLKKAIEVSEKGYRFGPNCKDDDYACNTCGGDIRGKCCQWAYTHDGNKEIAEHLKSLLGGLE